MKKITVIKNTDRAPVAYRGRASGDIYVPDTAFIISGHTGLPEALNSTRSREYLSTLESYEPLYEGDVITITL